MHAALKAKTTGFAANVQPIIREIRMAGHTSHNAIAAQLAARKVPTARGGKWTHVQVRQITARLISRPHSGALAAALVSKLLIRAWKWCVKR